MNSFVEMMRDCYPETPQQLVGVTGRLAHGISRLRDLVVYNPDLKGYAQDMCDYWDSCGMAVKVIPYRGSDFVINYSCAECEHLADMTLPTLVASAKWAHSTAVLIRQKCETPVRLDWGIHVQTSRWRFHRIDTDELEPVLRLQARIRATYEEGIDCRAMRSRW